MQELTVDFITSLDGYASAEGWPGWWGLEGPEYLGWLDEHPERDATLLMGATDLPCHVQLHEETELSRHRRSARGG